MIKQRTDKDILTPEDILKYIKDYEASTVPLHDKLWDYYLGKNPSIIMSTNKIKAKDSTNPSNCTPVSYGRKIITTFTGYAYRPRYITYKSDNEQLLTEIMACFNENVEHIKTSLHGRNTGDPRAIEAMQGAQAFQDAQTKRAREIDSRNLQDVAMTAYNGGNKAAVQAKLDIFSKTHGHRIEYDQVTGEDGVIKHVMKEVDPNTGQESVTEFTQDELGQVGEDPANLQKIIDNKAKFAQSERKLEQADYKLGQGDTKLEQGSRGLDIKEKALSLKKQISSESGVKPSDNLIEYALSLTNSGLTYTFPRSKQAIELQESFAKKWKEQGGESPSLARADYKAQSKALTSLVEQDARIEAFANTAKKNSDLILSMEGKILDMGSAFLNKPMRSLAMMTGVAPEIRAYNALITSIANEYTKLVTGDPKHALKKGDKEWYIKKTILEQQPTGSE